MKPKTISGISIEDMNLQIKDFLARNSEKKNVIVYFKDLNTTYSQKEMVKFLQQRFLTTASYQSRYLYLILYRMRESIKYYEINPKKLRVGKALSKIGIYSTSNLISELKQWCDLVEFHLLLVQFSIDGFTDYGWGYLQKE